MAKRYSGLATVTVNYDDRRSDYKATVTIGKRNVWSGRVSEPRSRTLAVDSPKAYDEAAHAALSFAVDDHPELAGAGIEYDDAGYGWHITRTKAKRSARHLNPGKRRPVRKGSRKASPKRKANGQFAKVSRAKRVSARRRTR